MREEKNDETNDRQRHKCAVNRAWVRGQSVVRGRAEVDGAWALMGQPIGRRRRRQWNKKSFMRLRLVLNFLF